jgi:hypothetical protein
LQLVSTNRTDDHYYYDVLVLILLLQLCWLGNCMYGLVLDRGQIRGGSVKSHSGKKSQR